MHDTIQHTLYMLAARHDGVRRVAVFCANLLVFGLAVIWMGIGLWHIRTVTIATGARLALVFGVSLLAARIITRFVHNPRPYQVEDLTPLTNVSEDNGFPSDHTLLAAALAANMWWIAPWFIPLFSFGMILVIAGRLAVGAHHTRDVLGSAGIVLVVALLAGVLPLPPDWNVPALRALVDILPGN